MSTLRPVDEARFDSAKMAKVGLWQSDRLLVGLNCFEPGQRHAPHVHAGSDKVYVVVEGRARCTLGDATSDLEPGMVAIAPSGVSHGIENAGTSRLVVLVFMAPPPRGA